jgi:hypothetical protein
MAESAKLFTKEMRSSEDPSWVRLREHLADQGIQVADAAIGDRFTESQGDFGVLVTRDGRVFTFLFSPGGQGDLRQQILDTRIQNWSERRSPDERFAYSGEIAAGLEVLQGESS